MRGLLLQADNMSSSIVLYTNYQVKRTRGGREKKKQNKKNKLHFSSFNEKGTIFNQQY